MLKEIRHYFVLERATEGSTREEMFLYSGVLFGVLAQALVAYLTQHSFDWPTLAVGLIVSIVSFPTVYYKAGQVASTGSFVKWCVAAQNGYFWPVLFEQVTKGFGH